MHKHVHRCPLHIFIYFLDSQRLTEAIQQQCDMRLTDGRWQMLLKQLDYQQAPRFHVQHKLVSSFAASCRGTAGADVSQTRTAAAATQGAARSLVHSQLLLGTLAWVIRCFPRLSQLNEQAEQMKAALLVA